MWAVTPSRVTTLVLAAVTALAPIAVISAPAADARPRTGHASHVDGVPNPSETRAWSRAAREARSARAGRTMLLADLGALPPAMRRLYRVGAVRHGAFTFSAVGELSCLSWHARGQSTFTAGPCRRPARHRVRTPLRDAAVAVGVWADVAARSAGVEGVLKTVDVTNLTARSGMLAPRGVVVTGVVDRNRDGLDDDARVAFRKDGRVVCARLPLTVRGRPLVFRIGCRRLPRRDLTHLRTAYDRLAEYPPG
jgi:hypothetical protein